MGDGTANYRNVAVKSDALALEAHRPEKATLPAGINPISLYIGSESWKDYSLSFDFLLNDNGGLEFTVYHLSGPVGFWAADGVMIKDIKIVHQD